MSLRLSICVFYLLLSSAAMPAQDSSQTRNSRQKIWPTRPGAKAADRAKQVQIIAPPRSCSQGKEVCRCVQQLPRRLDQRRQAWLASAIALYKSHDLDKAESTAKLVTSYDQKLSGQARFLLDLIKNERLLNQVKAAWAKGDFNTVLSSAQAITSADSKAAATVFVNNVAQYNGYIDQAEKLAQTNPQGAIAQLTLAQNLNPNGPGNRRAESPSCRRPCRLRARLRRRLPRQARRRFGRRDRQEGCQADERCARRREAGQAPDALNDYAMVLKLQPRQQGCAK